MDTSHEVQTVEQSLERLYRTRERLHARGGDRYAALRSTASLWSRGAHPRRDQAFGLKAFQCGVYRPWRNIASCAIRQFGADGHAIRVVAESENRQKNHLFEFPQICGRCHLNCIVVQIKNPIKVWPVKVDPPDVGQEEVVLGRTRERSLANNGWRDPLIPDDVCRV